MTQRWLHGAALSLLAFVAGCSSDAPSSASAPGARVSTSPTTEASTPEEAAAKAATPVLRELIQVSDAARQDPGARDWEPEIRRHAADPAAYLAVQSVREYATLGLRQNGNTQFDVKVTDVQLASPAGPSVKLTGCYDSGSTQVVDADTGAAVPPGTPDRYVWDVTVVQYQSEAGSPWLVTTLDPRTDQPC
ncbi:hypothetical protein [Modestobacter lapidis]|nr:hypothetical protein [Modestobacter lapidis]